MDKRRKLVSIVAGILAGILILSLILGLIPPTVRAASSSEIKDQLEELEKEQEELQNQIDDLKDQQDANVTEIRAIMEQKNIIDQQVGLLYTQINNLNEQIATYNVLIADKQEELDAAQKRLDDLTELNKERIRAMEKNGKMSYWSVLAEANTFFELLDRLHMVQEIAEADSRRLKEMKQAAQDVEDAQAVLLVEREAMRATKAELDVTQGQLEIKSQQAQDLLSQLIAKGAEFDALMSELENEQKEFSDQIAEKQEEYDDAKYSEHMATATKPTFPSGGGNAGEEVVDPSGLTWLVPVNYTRVTSPFGPRTHPITGEPNKMHNGVDLWAPNIYGQPIYATRGGYVSLAGWYGSGGWTVKIQHDSMFISIYMHMTHFVVNEGDYVAAGQIIGYVGSTGGSTGPHLHFEIRKNGIAVNPMEYIT